MLLLPKNHSGREAGRCPEASDNAICFCELAPNILRDLETTISSLFSPLLKENDEWVKADLKNEFMTESEKFANDLKEALNSMDIGLELRRPDRSILAETVNNAGHGVNGARMLHSPKLITHYEEVLKVVQCHLDVPGNQHDQ
ncbi:hypothetical protein PR002_g27657 [Phytophthora rubi]|uniref:Uncharacterized protein n=1 Tax=Phytophthora rubi TaxID=129364 RepID=A0A6A3HGN6_9STRA|nr:hypothetical protein PR002_g27657 [Phytophthora rubi]